jgi:hypothetical protein
LDEEPISLIILQWRALRGGMTMDKVESLEEQVQALTPSELAQFRAWFLEFDWTRWDAHVEQDVASGRLTAIVHEMRSDSVTRRTAGILASAQPPLSPEAEQDAAEWAMAEEADSHLRAR